MCSQPLHFRQVNQSTMLWLKVEVPGWDFSPYWLTMVSMQLSPSSQTRMLQRAQSTALDLATHAISKPDTCGCRKEYVAENHLKVVHVPGKQNRSDVLTKPCAWHADAPDYDKVRVCVSDKSEQGPAESTQVKSLARLRYL